MDAQSAINKTLIAILFVLILFLSYYIHQNLPGEIKSFSTTQTPEINSQISKLKTTANQFIPNMRFNHNDISYFLKPGCDEDKIKKMQKAFQEIEERTGVITFHKQNNEQADIIIFCSEEQIENQKNIFIAGEGGPSKFLNLSIYPIILQGKINLYKSLYTVKCENPVVELHELLHVFGYNHVNDKNSVLYPYFSCSQKLGDDIISHMIRLYSIEPKSEIYFKNLTATKSGRNLNFEIIVENQGMIDAQNTTLEISSDKVIKELELKTLKIGSCQKLSVSNLKLSSRNTNKATFELKTATEEFDKSNNIMNVEFE